jgi:hypothetical protein
MVGGGGNKSTVDGSQTMSLWLPRTSITTDRKNGSSLWRRRIQIQPRAVPEFVNLTSELQPMISGCRLTTILGRAMAERGMAQHYLAAGHTTRRCTRRGIRQRSISLRWSSVCSLASRRHIDRSLHDHAAFRDLAKITYSPHAAALGTRARLQARRMFTRHAAFQREIARKLYGSDAICVQTMSSGPA